MAKKNRLVYILLSAFCIQTVINLWWVFDPGKISPFLFVVANVVFGMTWICSLAIWVVRLIRAGGAGTNS
jgi:hypothetical protein